MTAVTGHAADGPGGDAAGEPSGPGRLYARADTLRARRTPFVQATVVRALKPTSAKAGDRALVLPDGTVEGFVGGSCAESSVRAQGMRVLRAGEPVVLRIIPGDSPPPHEEAAGGEGVVTVSNPCASGGMLEIFLEGVFPPPLVQVSGDAPIARALHRVGAALGYDVRPATGTGPPAPDAAAVIVASHGRDEEPVLTAALRAGVPYVGLVASRRRGAQVAAALDLTVGEAHRLHTPAGLDIGSRTPEEIALSIFAEIISERWRSPAPPPPADAAVSQPEAPPPADAAARPPEAAPAAEATDPVCGMTVAASEATPHVPHDGRMWYFCGPGCRQAFADDPARYQA